MSEYSEGNYTIISSSLAYAKFAAMSFCFGISSCSSPFFANVIFSSMRLTCHPRYMSKSAKLIACMNEFPHLLGESNKFVMALEEQ